MGGGLVCWVDAIYFEVFVLETIHARIKGNKHIFKMLAVERTAPDQPQTLVVFSFRQYAAELPDELT